MFKTSMDLGNVNKFLKLKFSLVIQSENFMPLLNKFNIGGNDYLKVSPIPLITLEIRSNVDKKEEWNPNRSICLSKVTKFIFCNRLKEIIEEFKKEKDLFFYQGETLCVNKELSMKLREKGMVRVGTKVCLFQPIVVHDEESKEQFEGVVFMINSAANYCTLTFEEMEYLASYLRNMDIDSLSLQLINITFLCNKMKTKEIEKPKKLEHETIPEEQQEVSRLPMKDEPTIPPS